MTERMQKQIDEIRRVADLSKNKRIRVPKGTNQVEDALSMSIRTKKEAAVFMADLNASFELAKKIQGEKKRRS